MWIFRFVSFHFAKQKSMRNFVSYYNAKQNFVSLLHVHGCAPCPLSMLHAHFYAALSCPCCMSMFMHMLHVQYISISCCMSISMMQVYVSAECLCPCCMSMSILHILVHAEWPCPCCVFMSRLHIHVHSHSACLCPTAYRFPGPVNGPFHVQEHIQVHDLSMDHVHAL